jgi:UDP-N-acetylmuramate dehydrogenase
MNQPAASASSGVAPDWADAAAEVAREAGVRFRRNEPLAGHTTMRVGGPADVLVEANDVPTLIALVRAARAAGVPLTVLGRGSDVVVADAGIRGLVVLSRAQGCRIEGDRLIADAGLPLARAATLAQQAGLSGLEFGLAIPGTVGGAVWGNAGAHGADVAGALESVTLLLADGREADEPASALALTYRDSRLKQPAGEQPGGTRLAGDLILTATFHLAPADPTAIKARLDDIRRWRREHQPLSQPSAGSVFRNPPGDSAGRLIDACGLKGMRVGGAEISQKHANFIVNVNGATATDVRRLAELARRTIAAKFGVELVYEVQFIGDWSEWHGESA